jgi:para-aminobenzoate synthetase component 1
MRHIKTYSCILTTGLKARLLHWANEFEEVVWLDSNDYRQTLGNYKAILAVDAFTSIKTDYHNAFEKLNEYQQLTKDWLFGYLTYDLKNDIEKLQSANFDGLHFPDLYFFQPKRVFLFSETDVRIEYLNIVVDELETDWEQINNFSLPAGSESKTNPIKIKLRTSKNSYFEKVKEMLRRIEYGDIYEANFCQEFYSENATLNPVKTFFHLNEISKPPFAGYLKFAKHYAVCASPERYIKKTGNRLLSQPIKGTAKRNANTSEDLKMIEILSLDPKERSENIMITDLVRNDLSRIAEKGSVKVDELCKIYTFEQVHQMISSISCTVPAEMPPVEIIKNTFPMGSMTGAPKISAMQIIEDLEDAKRGLYSGTLGYFTPDGDFDFNVIIRSILYNEETKYVSYSVGGAITAQSIPENEYEECLLKARAMREVLES